MKPIFSVIGVFLITCISVSASPATDYSFVREFGTAGERSNQFNSIDGIAVDRFGHVFVTDVRPHQPENAPALSGLILVKKWTVNGLYELLWGNNFEGRGLASGIDCSCDGDPFYITTLSDRKEAIIEHSTPEGGYLESFPDISWNYGYPFSFIDVAISGDGFAFGTFVKSDIGMAEPDPGVAKFMWDGTNWLTVAKIILTNNFEISTKVHGIDVDAWRGRVYVTVLADGTNGSAGVKVYDMDLNLVDNLSLWDYNAMPYGIAVDNRNGSFFVCEGVSNIIQKFTAAGAPVTSWGRPGSGESEFNRPSDLDVDMKGYVYVADADNNRVQVFAPPQEGNLNFIVYKSKTIVKWKQKTKGKDRDVIMAKGMIAVDTLTNIFSGPGTPALKDLPISFWYGEIPVISNMMPTKSNNKGTKALYKPDKEHKVKLIYRSKGALIKFAVKLKKGDINGPLGINDNATLPPWLWVQAQMNLSTNYLGVHYMRLEHKNKVGKVYKAIKK